MLLLAILAVLGVILFNVFFEDYFDRVTGTFVGILAGFIVGLVITLVLGYTLPTHFEAKETVYLKNIYDNPEVSGRFFIGSGHFDSNETLHYSYMDSEGFRVFGHMNKEAVRVAEDNPETPYLITYKEVFNQQWWSLIAVNPDRQKKPEFHIPKGSIDSNYEIH